jgi:hypothetical protein
MSKRWLGQAASTVDVWTITVANVWATLDTVTVTINGKDLVITIGTLVTTAQVATTIKEAFNASSAPTFTDTTATCTPANGGATMPELAEYTASVVGSTVVLTARNSGIPGTIASSEVTAGSGTASIAHTVSATGPYSFTNAQNWSGGVAPANSDTLIYDNGSVPCKYDLNTALTGIILKVEPGYSGTIGLPLINADGSNTYNEYRTTSLTLAGGTATINGPITRCNLAFGANTAIVRVLATGNRPDPYTPVVLLTGGDGSSTLNVSKGDVSTAFYQGTTATFSSANTGYINNPLSDVSYICGAGTTLTTLTKNGGTALLYAGATTVTQDLAGGTLTINDAAAVTTVNVYGGTFNQNTTGTVGTTNLYGSSVLNFDGDPRMKTSTTVNVFSEKVTVIDNQRSVNSGVLTLATHGCNSVNVQRGGNTSIVYT